MKILIIGIGTQSEVLTQIIEDINSCYEIYYSSYSIDNITSNVETDNPNYIGDIFHVNDITKYKCITAIGDNHLRKTIVKKINDVMVNIDWISLIHPNAYISKNVSIGKGTVISPGACIQTRTTIGDHCIINTKSGIDHHCTINDYSHIAPGSTLCGSVSVGEGCMISAGATIIPKISLRAWTFIKASSLVKTGNDPIKIYEPYISKYKDSIIKAIDDGWISSQGKYVNETAIFMQNYFKVKHVLMVSNGTCATHCLFLALKYKYPIIDTIYVPNNVYVAAWNSILNEYSINSINVMEIDSNTLNINMDDDYILSLKENSAVLIVHNVGNIVNVPKLKRLRPDIIFIEDNCEGIFGKYEGIYTGTFNGTLASSHSFFANKSITSGEGGAIFTQDTDIYNYLKRIINQGNTDIKYIHDIHSYNYRITNLQAAILYDQLMDIDNILNIKLGIYNNYNNLIAKYPKILAPICDKDCIKANWIYTVIIDHPKTSFKQAETFMKNKGIDIRPVFYPINYHKHLENISLTDDQKQKSHFISDRCMMIPSYPGLTIIEQEYIIESINKYIINLDR